MGSGQDPPWWPYAVGLEVAGARGPAPSMNAHRHTHAYMYTCVLMHTSEEMPAQAHVHTAT
jgi:hypothetical protein